jgi:hypothetical protein
MEVDELAAVIPGREFGYPFNIRTLEFFRGKAFRAWNSSGVMGFELGFLQG